MIDTLQTTLKSVFDSATDRLAKKGEPRHRRGVVTSPVCLQSCIEEGGK